MSEHSAASKEIKLFGQLSLCIQRTPDLLCYYFIFHRKLEKDQQIFKKTYNMKVKKCSLKKKKKEKKHFGNRSTVKNQLISDILKKTLQP